MSGTPGVVVVGCGQWGQNLVRNFHQLGALRTVCDATEVGRERALALAPGVTVTRDLSRALAADAAGVAIATPAETHVSLARAALAAGKDVFVEKPLAMSVEEGRVLVSEAGADSRVLMVGHVLEYHPAIALLTRLVHDGELGELRYIYSNRLSLGKIRREENILWSFAPHDVAVILRLVGASPREVGAVGGNYVQPHIADVTVTHLAFDNGVRAHIHVSWLHPFKEHRLVVIGDRKMATYDDVSKALTLYDQRVEWHEGEPIPVRAAGEVIPFPSDEPLRLECAAFLEAIRTRTAPLTDGASGLRVLEVLAAAQASLSAGGAVVPLVSGEADR